MKWNRNMLARNRRMVFIVGLSILVASGLIVSADGRQSMTVIDSDLPVAPVPGLLGKWTGPEGTYLDLQQDGNVFVIEIQSLDSRNVYKGRAVENQIVFERNGKTETIRKGSGANTGMKWLLDKQNCLIIREGEGYCRG